MCSIAFVATSLAFSSHALGARSAEYQAGSRTSASLSEFKHVESNRLDGAPNALSSLGMFLLACNPASAFQPPLQSMRPAVASQQHRLHVTRYTLNRAGSEAVFLMTGSSSEAKEKAARPTVGDKVVVLDTKNTREYCPELIGSMSEIVGDAEDTQPYQLEGSKCWLHVEDVEVQQLASSPSRGASEQIQSSAQMIQLENEAAFNAKGDEAASEDKIVVVALFASWCRVCAAVKPKMKRVIKDWPDVEFCSIQLDKGNKPFAKKNGIKTLPWIWIFAGKKGQVESFQMGPGKLPKLSESLQIWSLDLETSKPTEAERGSINAVSNFFKSVKQVFSPQK